MEETRIVGILSFIGGILATPFSVGSACVGDKNKAPLCPHFTVKCKTMIKGLLKGRRKTKKSYVQFIIKSCICRCGNYCYHLAVLLGKKNDGTQRQNLAGNKNASTSEEDYDWEAVVGAQKAALMRNQGVKMCRNYHVYSAQLTKCPICMSAIQYQESLVEAYSSYSKDAKQELVNTFQNAHYDDIVGRVAHYLNSNKKGANYAENNFFHYPMPQWHLQAIDSGCKQLLFDYKGLTPDRCFDNISPEGIRELFELCHFSFLSVEKTAVETVYKMNFRHKVEGQTSFAYCKFSDLSTLDRPFHSRVYERVLRPQGMSHDIPLLVDVVEKNGVIKICHPVEAIAIATKFAYVSQKYPHRNRKSRRSVAMDIDGKPTEMAIEIYEFPDGSEKEFIFDMSDINTSFDGFEDANINFSIYRYFYDHGIIRMNKATKECEFYRDGKFVKTQIPPNIEDRLNDADDDLAEFNEDIPREVELLYEELSRGKTIKY